jgi:hypothetical protein
VCVSHKVMQFGGSLVWSLGHDDSPNGLDALCRASLDPD